MSRRSRAGENRVDGPCVDGPGGRLCVPSPMTTKRRRAASYATRENVDKLEMPPALGRHSGIPAFASLVAIASS